MINDELKRKKKLEKILKLTDIPESEINKMDYKLKQEYFKAKSQLGKLVFVSRNKKGEGITYVKAKENIDE